MATVRNEKGEDVTLDRLEAIHEALPPPAPRAVKPPPPLPPTSPAPAWAPEDRLTTLFHDGARAGGARPFTVKRAGIGTVALPSGKVVATDPLTDPDAKPIFGVAPGAYPVWLSVAVFDDQERTAAALVLLGPGQPRSWERIGQHIVDSGTSSFMDPKAAKALAKDPDEELSRALVEALEREGASWTWANFALPGKAKPNAVVFSSGWGDGTYETFVGRDADGQPVALVTDFEVA